MKAVQLSSNLQGQRLTLADVPVPTPHGDEMLIRVRAAGVTPTELDWYPTTHTREGGERKGAIPGHEFSGRVSALGTNVRGFPVGAEVFGMNDWFADGASAEYCIARADQIAAKPASLSHAAAATVPISALTAWQGLFERAHLGAGERVLIHGASGAVGLFAVQLAHRAGAHVIGTASGRNAAFVQAVGANQVIDYRDAQFDEIAGKVDVVFDTVGGETLARSWQLLADPARMVTIASESSTDERARKAFFIVEANRTQLEDIAAMLDRGELKTFVKQIYSLQQAEEAFRPGNPGHGKNVLSV